MFQGKPKTIVILAAAALIAAGAVYLIGQGGGNPDGPAMSEAAARLDAVAIGEVANFKAKPV
ncbi:MAG TPA: TlpA family protein disulfide reductase, partial [Rhodobiaceae bacterium]|nr:TlpA family protein disulfide reductase [Rhodobiaceae bacterium]